MAPHKVLGMFAGLLGGGLALGWALQKALESGAPPGLMKVLALVGAGMWFLILWVTGTAAAAIRATPDGVAMESAPRARLPL
jgi:hypothetical protein